MFVVLLTYIAPLKQIDALLPEHVVWLEEQYASGRFLASGRRVPRTGGVILARGAKEDIYTALAGDPFSKAGVAEYQVVEFEPTKAAPELTFLIQNENETLR
jgi:uncharacterized protein YciI